MADLVVRPSVLRAVELGPPRRRRDRRDPCPLPRRGRRDGTSVIRGAGELRHKESDRIDALRPASGRSALGSRSTAKTSGSVGGGALDWGRERTASMITAWP
jgi:hypothetical protein